MFNDSETDFQDDIVLPVGCDLFYSFSIQPLDVTGCTAEFITGATGSYTVALSVVVEGDQPVSTFTVDVPPGSLPAVSTLDSWKIRVTFPGGQVLPYGHGGLLFTSE